MSTPTPTPCPTCGALPGKRRPAGPGGLSPRETEIATALANGETVRALAVRLGISPKTGDAHKTNLMKKLGVHNRAQLTLWAVREGLVKL